jgi:hypothetical protein
MAEATCGEELKTAVRLLGHYTVDHNKGRSNDCKNVADDI